MKIGVNLGSWGVVWMVNELKTRTGGHEKIIEHAMFAGSIEDRSTPLGQRERLNLRL